MSFGSLASKQPGAINTNEVLYTAPAGKLVEGKVYIVNQNSSPIKFRVGLSTGGVGDYNPASGYIIFNQELAVGEYFQSDNIYFANGQSVVIRSDSTAVNFNLLGFESDDTLGSGFVAEKVTVGSNDNELMFTASGEDFTGNLYVCNRSSFDTRVRVGLGTTDRDYIEYNYTVERETTHFREGLRIGSGEMVYVRSDDPGTNFVLTGYYGASVSNVFPNNVGVGSTLQATDVYAVESVAIGISDPANNALKVIGSSELTDVRVTDSLSVDVDVNVSGIITAAGGFASGTGNPVEITLSGSDLTFTVQGVGTTTLTLF
jgi:hypothetical protein